MQYSVSAFSSEGTFEPMTAKAHPKRIISELRTRLELSDLFLFLYLTVFFRQYMWIVQVNYLAWIITLVLAGVVWAIHVSFKQAIEERTPRLFWLIVAVPLLIMFGLKFALPDISFDVLNQRLVLGERGLNGPLFISGDFFPTIFPFNPASDMLTGISRRLLGYRLGTIINYLTLLYAGIVLNKLLRPFIVNAHWRCLGILLALFTEHILFEINNYMVDLLALPLLLEATHLVLREDGNNKQSTRDLVYVGLHLGACVAFKLTNVVAVGVIVFLLAYRILRKRAALGAGMILRVAMALLIALLPIAPHAIYIYRETGSPVFPLYNKVFGSPFWAPMNIFEGRFGPETLWQTLVWPVIMFFRPQRIAELPYYSGRLTIGYIAAICCLLLPRIHRHIRLLSCALLLGSLLWSATVGYIRYALYLELLGGVIVVYLVTFARQISLWVRRPSRFIGIVFTYLIISILAVQFVAAARYAYYYEWSMRPAFFEAPGVHRKDARFVLRDRHLIDFLSIDDRTLIPQVGAWVVSNIKMNGIQVLLRNDVPMIANHNPQYFEMPRSRERFAKAMDDVKGRRMFSLSLIQDLNESLNPLKRRRLQPVQVTPLTLPFFSKHTLFYMALIETAPAPKPETARRTGVEAAVTETRGPLDYEAFKATISMPAPPLRLTSGRKVDIQVVVKNVSDYLWPARGQPDGKFFLNVGNIWFDSGGEKIVNNLDARMPIPQDVYPGEELSLTLSITAPVEPGEYVLEIDMLQEGVTWFKDQGSTPLRIRVEVE